MNKTIYRFCKTQGISFFQVCKHPGWASEWKRNRWWCVPLQFVSRCRAAGLCQRTRSRQGTGCRQRCTQQDGTDTVMAAFVNCYSVILSTALMWQVMQSSPSVCSFALYLRNWQTINLELLVMTIEGQVLCQANAVIPTLIEGSVFSLMMQLLVCKRSSIHSPDVVACFCTVYVKRGF